ncbi:hypothetical protein GCM10009609_26620 [Pseudonocardia aurantiaca]
MAQHREDRAADPERIGPEPAPARGWLNARFAAELVHEGVEPLLWLHDAIEAPAPDSASV